MPKLSIITINYNNCEGLRKTIQSVVSQTYHDFEYLVIDGGSTDGSTHIIKEFEDRITWSISKKDNGIYDAQNKGIQKATGEFCLFLNSGDYLLNEKVLSDVSKHFINNPADILYGDIVLRDGKGKFNFLKKPHKITLDFLFNSWLPHPCTFIKRTVFQATGLYDTSFKIAADYDFFINAIHKQKVSVKKMDLFVSVFDENGISNSEKLKAAKLEERRRAQLKYFGELTYDQLILYNNTKSKLDHLEAFCRRFPVNLLYKTYFILKTIKHNSFWK